MQIIGLVWFQDVIKRLICSIRNDWLRVGWFRGLFAGLYVVPEALKTSRLPVGPGYFSTLNPAD